MANFEAFHMNFSSCIIFVFLKSVATIYVQRLASRSVVPMWFCHLRTLWWSNAEKKIKTFWWCNFACIKEFKRIVQLSYKSLINLVICRKIPPKKVVQFGEVGTVCLPQHIYLFFENGIALREPWE